MLCLNERTPAVVALSLSGCVLFIIGGATWGGGYTDGDQHRIDAGACLTAFSLALLCFACLGCWLNSRKSSRSSSIIGVKRGSRRQLRPPVESEAYGWPSRGERQYRSFRSSRRAQMERRQLLMRHPLLPSLALRSVHFPLRPWTDHGGYGHRQQLFVSAGGDPLAAVFV